MSTIIKSYNLFIDSSQRDEGDSPSDFSIILRRPITKTNNNSVFRVRITSCVIPFSFNQVNSSNNILQYTFNGNPFSITIPSGNYSIIDLLTEMESLIFTNNNCLLNFVYDISTSKCTLGFKSGNLSSMSITMLYTTTNIILMKMLGFTQNITFSFTSPSTYVDVFSNQPVNVSPSKCLFIRSSTLIQNTNYESLVDKNDTTDILAQIPITTGYNTFINWYDQSSDLFCEINNIIIDKINIYLSDATSFNQLPSDSGLLNWFLQINIQEIFVPTNIDVSHINDNLYIGNSPIVKTEESDIIKELENKKDNLKNDINTLLKKKSQAV